MLSARALCAAGLWLYRRIAKGLTLSPFPFPLGFPQSLFPWDSLHLLFKESFMDQALSYTEVHSFASVGLSTLACGIWLHLSGSFLSLYFLIP